MGDEKDIALHGATRFAKKPAKVTGLCIRKHHPESALLLPLQGHQDPRVLDELDHRLRVAKESPEANQSILNWFQNRPEYWSRHPEPPQAPILFNYYFRARPKHFLSPLSIPYADNYYGVAPENGMSPIAVFALLNSTAVCLELEANSRTQGSGLHKLQLFEYRQAYVPARKMFCSADLRALEEHGERLSQSRSRDLQSLKLMKQCIAPQVIVTRWIQPN